MVAIQSNNLNVLRDLIELLGLHEADYLIAQREIMASIKSALSKEQDLVASLNQFFRTNNMQVIETVNGARLQWGDEDIAPYAKNINDKLAGELQQVAPEDKERLAKKRLLEKIAACLSNADPDYSTMEKDIEEAIANSQLNTTDKSDWDFFQKLIVIDEADINQGKYIANGTVKDKVYVLEMIKGKTDTFDLLLAKYEGKIPFIEQAHELKSVYRELEHLAAALVDIKKAQDENPVKIVLLQECSDLLTGIERTALPENDYQMKKYLHDMQQQLVDNKFDLEELKNIKQSITETHAALTGSNEILAVLNAVDRLQNRKRAYTVGVQAKVERIRTALYELPIEQRASVLTGPINQVQRELAARRPVFFGKTKPAAEQEHTIVKDKAATAYKEAIQFKEKAAGDADEDTSPSPD